MASPIGEPARQPVTTSEVDETVAAHVALRKALVPSARTQVHEVEGALATSTDVACPNCNTIYVYDAAAAPAEAGDFISLLLERGLPFHFTVRSSIAARYERTAAAAGLAHLVDLPLMVLGPDAFRPTQCPAELDLRVLEADADALHLDLVAQGLGMSREGIQHLMSAENRASPNWTTYAGDVEGALAVTGSSISSDSGTGLISIVTAASFGRRGFAAALTSAMIADAFERNAPRVFLHSSDQGLAVYHRLGFTVVEHLRIYGAARH